MKSQQQMYAMQMGQQQKAGPSRPLSKETIRVVAETQTNSVIVTANEDNLADIRKMVERLDQRGSATVKVKFYSLKHSDAIAVAVRTGSTIYVDARVLDEAGVEPDQADDSEESDAKLAVFRDFVNSLDVDLPPGEMGPPAEEQSS